MSIKLLYQGPSCHWWQCPEGLACIVVLRKQAQQVQAVCRVWGRMTVSVHMAVLHQQPLLRSCVVHCTQYWAWEVRMCALTPQAQVCLPAHVYLAHTTGSQPCRQCGA
jgi:hypothetical protein